MNRKCLEGLEDQKLVARVQTRDAASRLAFAVLVERYRGRLMRRCHARLGNRQDAEDALQETMLRAYRGLHGFRGEAALGTWLTAIADNQCASLAAKRARHIIGGHLRQLIELQEELRQNPRADTGEGHEQVHQALSRASRRDREILRLRFFHDLSLEQIADTLGIGMSASKMRLYRALERLATQLGDQTSPETI